MRPQEPKGRSIPVAAVAVGGLAALLVVYELMQAPGSSLARIIQVCPQSGFENCTQLQRYSPSVWEAEYSAQMANGSAPSCDLGPRQHERVAAWLAATGSGVPPTSHDVLSTFEWLDTCSGEEFVQHIEPLVGHFRCVGLGGAWGTSPPLPPPPPPPGHPARSGVQAAAPLRLRAGTRWGRTAARTAAWTSSRGAGGQDRRVGPPRGCISCCVAAAGGRSKQ